jgi:hypothetical protein
MGKGNPSDKNVKSVFRPGLRPMNGAFKSGDNWQLRHETVSQHTAEISKS